MKFIESLFLWFLALLITLGMAKYQRQTGPTYPLEGSTRIGDTEFEYSLDRSHGGLEDHLVSIINADPAVKGYLVWKRYKFEENLHRVDFVREDEKLVAYLPHQPPAGKLEYQLVLYRHDEVVKVPEKEPVVIRFKGSVPAGYLVPHILLMFLAMLTSVKTVMNIVLKKNSRNLVYITLFFLVVGGLILGPIVQKYAFGAYWTGWPFGEDLTDNKLAFTVLAWIFAAFMYRGKNPETKGKWWAILATVILFGVYFIPHSMRGSELDYNTLPPDSLNKSIEYETRINADTLYQH